MSSLRDIYKKSIDDYDYKLKIKPKRGFLLWFWIILGLIILGCGFWRFKYVNFVSDAFGAILIIFGIIVLVLFPFFTFFGRGVSDLMNAPSRDKIDKFICHNCLKSVLIEQLDFKCPFCDKQYGKFKNRVLQETTNDLDGAIATKILSISDLSEKEKALFDKCSCESKIQFVECYHCGKPINLFAEYKKDELEAKRYV